MQFLHSDALPLKPALLIHLDCAALKREVQLMIKKTAFTAVTLALFGVPADAQTTTPRKPSTKRDVRQKS